MRCHKITLVNFCQHRYRQVDLADGLTAVIGANGSGKSNVLGGIRMALTGENPNAGTKDANICDQAPEEEKSYVELEFSHANTHAVVRRNLRPNKPTAVLTFPATGEVVEGDTVVTQRIEQMLGIDRATINNIVIVAQDEIFGFLDHTLAKRDEQFQKLFHTAQAGVVHKALGDHLKTVQIPSTGLDTDQLIQQSDKATATINDVQSKLVTLPGYDDMQKYRSANVQIMRDYQDRQSTQQQFESVSQRRQQTQVAQEAAVQKRAKSQQELDLLLEARSGKQEKAQEARSILSNLHQVRQNTKVRNETTAQLSEIDKQLTALVSPVRPDVYASPNKITEQLTELSREKKNLEAFLASFQGDVAKCPTCGTSTTQLADKLNEAEMRHMVMVNEYEAALIVQAQSFEYDQSTQRYQTLQNSLQVQREQIQRHLAALPVCPEVTADEQVLNSVIMDANSYENGINDYQQLLRSLDTEIGGYTGSITTLTEQLTQLQQRLGQLPLYTDEQNKQAEQDIAGWDTTAQNRRGLESQLAIAQTEERESRRQLEAASSVQAQASMLTAWHEYVDAIRGVLHRDAAPRFVAQRNLRRLQQHMNQSLEMFDTNYRVEASEGLSFKALFHNGSEQPAERLSEGQKVILALSFRLALNLMFADNIGAMYLDEPTAYLDEHHIRGFEPILDQLKQYSTSRGLQCIIITHERGLAPLFDSVVSL